MTTKQLENKVKRITRSLEKGDAIEMLYDGECIAKYDNKYGEIFSPDTKTPLQWLRGCLVFEVALRGRDASKVELVHKKC